MRRLYLRPRQIVVPAVALAVAVGRVDFDAPTVVLLVVDLLLLQLSRVSLFAAYAAFLVLILIRECLLLRRSTNIRSGEIAHVGQLFIHVSSGGQSGWLCRLGEKRVVVSTRGKSRWRCRRGEK